MKVYPREKCIIWNDISMLEWLTDSRTNFKPKSFCTNNSKTARPSSNLKNLALDLITGGYVLFCILPEVYFLECRLHVTMSDRLHLGNFIEISLWILFLVMKVYPREKYIFWNAISMSEWLTDSRMNFKPKRFHSIKKNGLSGNLRNLALDLITGGWKFIPEKSIYFETLSLYKND
jgi:hypothetical protein